MERLTNPLCGGYELPMIPMEIKTQDDLQKFHEVRKFYESCAIRCGQYEDTGLEPEEIKNALDVNDIIPEINVTIDRLRELIQAEQEGRLFVPPFKTGDTVYVTGECRIMECFIDETYLDDRKGIEYLVSFDCDNNCEGCPFNDWHQEFSGEYSCNGEWGQTSIRGADLGKTVFLTREEAEAALAQNGR